MKIIELEKEFKKSGWVHKRIAASDNAYIYSKRHEEVDKVYYEVFKRKEVNTFEDFENRIIGEDKKVSYPSNEQFGSDAWCFSTYEAALEKFEDLKFADLLG